MSGDEAPISWTRWTDRNGVPHRVKTSATNNPLKFMAPGHFCPDVCGIEDFGDADTWRGKTVRGFFRLMKHWPKP